MERILGIDTGTNSLGWGIVENYENGKYKLIDYGSVSLKKALKSKRALKSQKRQNERNLGRQEN